MLSSLWLFNHSMTSLTDKFSITRLNQGVCKHIRNRYDILQIAERWFQTQSVQPWLNLQHQMQGPTYMTLIGLESSNGCVLLLGRKKLRYFASPDAANEEMKQSLHLGPQKLKLCDPHPTEENCLQSDAKRYLGSALHENYLIFLPISGNWAGDGKFKIWFKSGGAIEFGQALIRAGKLGKFKTKLHLVIAFSFLNARLRWRVIRNTFLFSEPWTFQ